MQSGFEIWLICKIRECSEIKPIQCEDLNIWPPGIRILSKLQHDVFKPRDYTKYICFASTNLSSLKYGYRTPSKHSSSISDKL